MSLLEGRPLLDLGTGDGQTLRALDPGGLVIGLDRSAEALQAALGAPGSLVCAEAAQVPLRDSVISVVVAGDLFHHLDDSALDVVLAEVRRVLRPGGRLVAWWYEQAGRGGPGDPAHARAYEDVARILGMKAQQLELVTSMGSGPPTVGLIATL